jgi:hypothetical protein
MEAGAEGAAMAVLTRHKKWSPLEVHVLVAKIREDLKNPQLHCTLSLYDISAPGVRVLCFPLTFVPAMLYMGENRCQAEDIG